jgi:GTP-dependent phosphoenolpyruvate carboxykinase
VSPAYKDLNWTGLDFSAEQFEGVTSIDKTAWEKELQRSGGKLALDPGLRLGQLGGQVVAQQLE